jgi:hypothetical protein
MSILDQPIEPDPVIEVYKLDIDRTLIPTRICAARSRNGWRP